MMTEDIVACNSETAAFIFNFLRRAPIYDQVSWETLKTVKFPMKWTQETATDFTRFLRQCDQRAMEIILRKCRSDSIALNLLEMVGDLQLPEGWVDSFTESYDFLKTCLDMGQPIDVRKIEHFDKGHYAIIKCHPGATPQNLKAADAKLWQSETNLCCQFLFVMVCGCFLALVLLSLFVPTDPPQL